MALQQLLANRRKGWGRVYSKRIGHIEPDFPGDTRLADQPFDQKHSPRHSRRPPDRHAKVCPLIPISLAVSMGRRNTSSKSTCRCPSPKLYPRLKVVTTNAVFGLATGQTANDTNTESQFPHVESPTTRIRRSSALIHRFFTRGLRFTLLGRNDDAIRRVGREKSYGPIQWNES